MGGNSGGGGPTIPTYDNIEYTGDSKLFTSLQKCVDRLRPNGTIALGKNISLENNVIFNKKLTFDLNQFTLSLNNSKNKLIVSNGGDVSFKNGSIELQDDNNDVIISINNGGKAIFENLNWISDNTNATFISNSGEIIIKDNSNIGSLILGDNSTTIFMSGYLDNISDGGSNYNLIIEDGYFADGVDVNKLRGNITISGGMFKLKPNDNLLADGYIVKDSDDGEYPFMVIKN